MTEITLRNYLDVGLADRMGTDQSICRAARVSTLGTGAFATDESQGLINFLMRERHGSPFEHNAMTFRVSEIIATSREFKRHRIGFSFSEESGRYRTLEPVFYTPPAHRPLIQVGKPGEYTYKRGTLVQTEFVRENLMVAYQAAWDCYEKLLYNGIAKEVARFALPVGLYTSSYVTCNARSLMAFLSLRTSNEDAVYPSHPMWEIEQVAKQMEQLFSINFPLTYAAFNKNGRVAP